jgi:hypothetical protein
MQDYSSKDDTVNKKHMRFNQRTPHVYANYGDNKFIGNDILKAVNKATNNAS